MEIEISIQKEIGFERLHWFICGYLHPPISGNIFPRSFSNGWWLVGLVLVCWIDFFLFPSHGLFGLCLSTLSHSSSGEGILSCFGGMLTHLCHALEYMHFHVFHSFGKSKNIFVYFKASLAKLCFVCSYFGHYIFWICLLLNSFLPKWLMCARFESVIGWL